MCLIAGHINWGEEPGAAMKVSLKLVIVLVLCFLISTPISLILLIKAPQSSYLWGYLALGSFMVLLGISGNRFPTVIRGTLIILAARCKLLPFYLALGEEKAQKYLSDVARIQQLVSNGYWEQALQACDKVMRAPEWKVLTRRLKAEVGSFRANALFRLGRSEEALEQCRRAVIEDPTSAMPQDVMGVLLSQLNRCDEAKLCFDKAISLAPKNPHHYINRAGIMVKLKNAGQASQDCDTAIRLGAKTAAVYINAGSTKLLLGKLAESVECSDKALKLDPKSVKAYLNRSSAKKRLGNVEGALADCTNAIMTDPRCAKAYATRASILATLKRMEQACNDCEKAVELEPANPINLMTCALALKRMGRFQDSLDMYFKALPTVFDKAACHASIAATYARMEDLESTIKHCDLAIEQDANCATAYNNRAWVLVHLGKYNEALADIERAFKVKPDPQAAYYGTRGVIYYALGRLEEAVKDLNRGLELDCDCGESYFFRAQAYEKMGQHEKAEQDRLKAKEHDFKPFSFSVLIPSLSLETKT